MKWFGYVTDTLARDVENRHRSFYILGLRVLERGEILYNNHEWTNKANTALFRRVLWGMVSITELYNRTGLFRRTCRVFGVPVYTFCDVSLYQTTRVLGLRIRHRPNRYLRDFMRDCHSQVAPEHDDIYVIILHLGDAFNNLIFIRQIIRNHASRRPLLMVFSRSFVDLIAMMCPDLPYVYIDTPRKYQETLATVCAGEGFRIGRQRYTILFNDWFWITTILEKRRELGMSCRRMDVLAICYHASYDAATMGVLHVLAGAERSMLEKCRAHGLDVDNFVLLAPEAFTEKLYDQDFWITLIERFISLGYEVYLNLSQNKQEIKRSNYLRRRNSHRRIELDDAEGCCSFFLTIAEVFALAGRARKIVTLRSGISEIFVQCGVPIDILYPGANGNVVERTMRFYRLDQYPLARSELIREYNMSMVSPQECMSGIFRDFPPSPRRKAQGTLEFSPA